jgi:hypothetical protein
MCHLFPLSHHGHELFFDRGRSFSERKLSANASCETLCNDVFSLFAELFALSLKFFHFPRLQMRQQRRIAIGFEIPQSSS